MSENVYFILYLEFVYEIMIPTLFFIRTLENHNVEKTRPGCSVKTRSPFTGRLKSQSQMLW